MELNVTATASLTSEYNDLGDRPRDDHTTTGSRACLTPKLLLCVCLLCLAVVALGCSFFAQGAFNGAPLPPEVEQLPISSVEASLLSPSSISLPASDGFPSSVHVRDRNLSISADLVCADDHAAVSQKSPQIFRSSQTWIQKQTETVRVKLWGGGGLGGSPVRMVPETGGCSRSGRVLRGKRGGYTGSRTRADLNNHANQMNPNNWRYWSSRGVQPPWQTGNSGSSGTGYRPADTYIPYTPTAVTNQMSNPNQGGYTGTGTTADMNNHANQLNPNTWRFWRSRGIPMALARHYAWRAATLGRKWLPPAPRWSVSKDPRRWRGDADCGEVWLCGGGGGAGGFSEIVLELKAGRKYTLEIGKGGSTTTPDGSSSRLLEFGSDGPRTLAQAHGGFAAGSVDESRVIALGGKGAPAAGYSQGLQSSLPGNDGQASRSDIQDLHDSPLLLYGADIDAARKMPSEDLVSSLSAVRIPCAAGARAGSIENEAGLQPVTSLFFDTADPNRPSLRQFQGDPFSTLTPQSYPQKVDPPSDHMLVCLPKKSGAYGSANDIRVQDTVYSKGIVLTDNSIIPNGVRGTVVAVTPQQTGGVQLTIDFPGRRVLVGTENSDAYLIARPFNQTQCIGVACVRQQSGGVCEALPSCLDGLAAWLGIPGISNGASITQHDYGYTTIQGKTINLANGAYVNLKLSSSGPRGGAAMASTPTGEPAGHGGDGSCPELVPAPGAMAGSLDDARPSAPAPFNGKRGLAVFYSCRKSG